MLIMLQVELILAKKFFSILDYDKYSCDQQLVSKWVLITYLINNARGSILNLHNTLPVVCAKQAYSMWPGELPH